MIAIAIIAVLAALAMPVHQDYNVRLQASEDLLLTQGAKSGIAEAFLNRGVFHLDNADAGVSSPGSITGHYVKSVTIGSGNGEISLLFGGKGNARISGQEVLLQAIHNGGSLSWQCSSSSIEPRFLPPSCR